MKKSLKDIEFERLSLAIMRLFLRTKKSETCNKCGGTGKIKQESSPYAMIKCDACGGNGRRFEIGSARFMGS